MKKNIFVLFVILISSFPNILLNPQTIPVEAYSEMEWRQVGPYRAGWGTVCDGIPDQPNTFYFGGAGPPAQLKRRPGPSRPR